MWGNGAAIAKVLACENGAYVFGCDLGLDAAEYTKRRLELEGGICDVLAADVTDSHQVQGLVDACMQKYGKARGLPDRTLSLLRVDSKGASTCW